MDILIEEHQRVLMALVDNKVDFLVIGGYAVIFYGYERTTGDIDIWLKPDNSNKPKLISALKELDVDAESIKAIDAIDLAEVQMFYMGDKPQRIDFLTKVYALSYEEAISEANYFLLGKRRVPILNYQHLILSKFNTGRAKDMGDLEELQRINKYREKR